jgi:hypothetical protein
MQLGRAALLLIAVGCDGRTAIRVDVSGPGLSLTALSLAVGWGGQSRVATPLPPSGGPPTLPGSVLVLLPDTPLDVDVTLSGSDEVAGAVQAHASVTTRPHEQVAVPMTLSASPEPMADLAVAADVAPANDLSDMSLPGDLAALPDLRPYPLVQLGAITTGTNSLTASLPSASRAGTLVVFTFAFDRNADPSLPAGWSRYSAYSTTHDAEIFYYPNNPGGITSVTATLGGATTGVGQVSEWQVGPNFDVGAWCQDSVDHPSPSPTCDTSMGTMHNGTNVSQPGWAFSCFSLYLGSAAAVTITPSAGWSVVGENDSTATRLHYQFSVQGNPPVGQPMSELPASSVAGRWAGAFISMY